MYNFNNNNIFTGYIKQLLKSFNLPMCPVLQSKEEADKYSNISGITYILNDQIIRQTQKGTEIVKTSETFIYNKEVPNFTKKLQITNTIYDTYTHEYLGDYLRFLRDYNHIDLMSMYNCFSNNICTNLNLKINLNNGTEAKATEAVFNTTDTNYKIYMVPVKAFKSYTIAIDANEPIEVACGLYGKKSYGSIINGTYEKFNNISFKSPVVYDKLTSITDAQAQAVKFEKDLKLFIKVPFNNNSSIVILEGIYLNTNDDYLEPNDEVQVRKVSAPYYCYVKEDGTIQDLANQKGSTYTATLGEIEETPYLLQWPGTKPESSPQTFNVLLESNAPGIIIQIDNPTTQLYGSTITQYTNLPGTTVTDIPRKAAALTRIPIYENNKAAVNFVAPVTICTYIDQSGSTPTEEISYSNDDPDAGIKTFKPIYKLQLLQQNTQESYPFADRLLEYLLENVVDNQDEFSDDIKRVQTALKQNEVVSTGLPGLWSDNLQCAMYAYMTDPDTPKHFDNFKVTSRLYDLLGYADKDTEKYYSYTVVEDNKKASKSLSGVDLYKEEW